MSVVHALVHTTGVVLGREYIPLEVAYCDVTGIEHCFLLQSPISFREAQRIYPNSLPDAIMSTQTGVTVATVRQFMHARNSTLQSVLKQSDIVFGFKGDSYQKSFIEQMHLPHIVNVEQLLVPSLHRLRSMYPHLVIPDCTFHVKPSRCALSAVRLLVAYMMEQNLILPLGQQ